MKQLLTLVAAVVLSATGVWAQCTPNAATGNPGLSPPTDSLPCVEVGVPYNQVVYLENFDQFSATVPIIGAITVTVDSLRIDSITNVPCGLTYQANKPSRTYYGGETGCIDISGTSYENLGQYRLNIYVTVWATAPVLGSQSFSGEAADVVDQVEALAGPLGVDFDYFLRVIQPSGTCPAIDRSNPAANLTASAACGPPVFTATISGNTEVCDGQTTTLTVSFTNGVPPYDILWSNGGTTATETVGAGTYSLTATDSNSETATATVTVSTLALPTADFTVTAGTNPGEVVITNSSSSATSYFWNFNEEGFDTATTPSFTFAENGTYDVTLTATNGCGADSVTESVTISNIVGIQELGTTLSRVQVVPNPNNGTFNLSLQALQTTAVSVKVINLQGQVVYTNSFNAVAGVATNQAVQLEGAATGLYIIQVQASDALFTEKLIVK